MTIPEVEILNTIVNTHRLEWIFLICAVIGFLFAGFYIAKEESLLKASACFLMCIPMGLLMSNLAKTPDDIQYVIYAQEETITMEFLQEWEIIDQKGPQYTIRQRAE